MNLNEAKEKFEHILSSLDDKKAFFSWIKEEHKVELDQSSDESNTLDRVAKYLRKKFPYGSKFSSNEHVRTQVNGVCSESSNLDKTIEIDGFLFDDDNVDELVDEGLIKRYYCEDCDSNNIALYDFITHSVSRETLGEIFKYYLDKNILKGKRVLDIGSRIGAFLYGCYLLGPKDCKITGIEMNKDLCDIQQEIVDKFKFGDRIKVINDDVMNCADTVSTSDVFFLHNIFEFFVSEDAQVVIWKFLKANIKKNAILLTIPSVEDMTRNLVESNFLEDWLDRLNGNQNSISLYQVR